MKNEPPKFKNKLVFESPETRTKKKDFFFTFLSKNWLKERKKKSMPHWILKKKVVMINKFMIWNGLK